MVPGVLAEVLDFRMHVLMNPKGQYQKPQPIWPYHDSRRPVSPHLDPHQRPRQVPCALGRDDTAPSPHGGAAQKGHNEIGTVSVKVWSLNYGSKSEYFQETSNDPCEVFRRIHRHLKRPYNCVRGAFSGFTLERTSSQAFFISSKLPRAQMRERKLLNPLSVGRSWLSGRLLDMINSLCITSPVGVLLENEGTISTSESPY